VAAGFLVPLVMLIIMVVDYSSVNQFSLLVSTGINSLKVSVIAATLAVFIALSFGFYQRFHANTFRHLPLRISGFGYAIPGTVLAMAMLSTLGPLDHWLNDMASYAGLTSPGLILSGSLFAIVFALVVRFLAIANGTVVNGIN
jgi:iron(III) transport system permease protein